MFIRDPAVVQKPGGHVVWVKKKGPEHVVPEYWIFCWLGPSAFTKQKQLFDRIQACGHALGPLAIICRRYASKRNSVQEFHEQYLIGPITIPFEKWNAHQLLLEEVVVDLESFFWFANRLLTHVALTLNFFFKKVRKVSIPGGKRIRSHATLVESGIFSDLPPALQEIARKLNTEVSDFRNKHIEHDMVFWRRRGTGFALGPDRGEMQLGITFPPEAVVYPERPLSKVWISLHDYVTEVAKFLGSQIK